MAETMRIINAHDFGGTNIKQIETNTREGIPNSNARSVAKADTVTDEAAFVRIINAHHQGRALDAICLSLPMTLIGNAKSRRFAKFQTKFRWWSKINVAEVEQRLATALK